MSIDSSRTPHARGERQAWVAFAAVMGFLGGMLVMAALVTIFPAGAMSMADRPVEAAQVAAAPAPTHAAPPAAASKDEKKIPATSADAVETLRGRSLAVPVKGVPKDALRDTFAETRGTARIHEALDIVAPRDTPVLAVEDGSIEKLFLSQAGGITVYQFDPSQTFCYYYAHLDRYAAGLAEGQHVSRGDVLGYVGTTGNAPRDTPHLHFAIFKLGADKRWWHGTPIDPYSVLR